MDGLKARRRVGNDFAIHVDENLPAGKSMDVHLGTPRRALSDKRNVLGRESRIDAWKKTFTPIAEERSFLIAKKKSISVRADSSTESDEVDEIEFMNRGENTKKLSVYHDSPHDEVPILREAEQRSISSSDILSPSEAGPGDDLNKTDNMGFSPCGEPFEAVPILREASLTEIVPSPSSPIEQCGKPDDLFAVDDLYDYAPFEELKESIFLSPRSPCGSVSDLSEERLCALDNEWAKIEAERAGGAQAETTTDFPTLNIVTRASSPIERMGTPDDLFVIDNLYDHAAFVELKDSVFYSPHSPCGSISDISEARLCELDQLWSEIEAERVANQKLNDEILEPECDLNTTLGDHFDDDLVEVDNHAISSYCDH